MALIGAFIVPHPPLIVPEIGKGEEKKIQKTIDAYHDIARRVARLHPETIILTTPHSILYGDYLHISPGNGAEGNFKSFGAPQIRMEVRYDEELSKSILRQAGEAGISAGFLGERNRSLDHGTMVPLYFINQQYSSYRLIRISISGMSSLIHYRFGKCIAKAVAESGKSVVWIASGDLSHKLKEDGPYGLSPEGPVFDRKITEAMASGDFGQFLRFDEDFCEASAECGLRSFLMMSGALDGLGVRSELLSYEGPFGVGYGIAAYVPLEADENRHFDILFEQEETKRISEIQHQEDPFVRLARKTLETFVKTRNRISRPEGLPEEMIQNKAGVFVSLKMDGKLRGCIGTISPTSPCIADEIIRNAIHSGTEDPRFDPVTEKELSRLVYSVDVLGEAEPISSRTELDVQRFGVIVRYKGRCGLLLPNLEGIDSPAEQIKIALQKGGINETDPYKMERFEVVRHH